MKGGKWASPGRVEGQGWQKLESTKVLLSGGKKEKVDIAFEKDWDVRCKDFQFRKMGRLGLPGFAHEEKREETPSCLLGGTNRFLRRA